MNNNDSTNKLISAGIALGIIVMIAFMIFSEIRKAEKESGLPKKKEIIKENIPAESHYAIPQSIFPTDAEVQKNMKSNQEKRLALDKALAERKQIVTEVRNGIEASFNENPTPTTGSAQPETASSNKQTLNPALKKARIEKFKNKELLIHH